MIYAYELWVQESVGIQSVSSSCTKLKYYLNSIDKLYLCWDLYYMV